MSALVEQRAELSLSIVDDRAIRKLNAQWRGKDKATDVLSFPVGDFPDVGVRPLGDVVISLQMARRAAAEHGVALNDELDRYLAHGLLHLLGHDHHRKADAQRMARAETKLLGAAGMLTAVHGERSRTVRRSSKAQADVTPGIRNARASHQR